MFNFFLFNLFLVIPELTKEQPNLIWQQDGHTGHTTRPVLEYLSDNVPCLKWPAKSPDVSIIENVWGIMKRRLEKLNLEQGEVNNVSRLERRMQDIWNGIEQSIIDNLYSSLPKRMKLLIDSNGAPIKY